MNSAFQCRFGSFPWHGRRWLRACLVLILASVAWRGESQSIDNFLIQSWETDQGLPQNHGTSIVQTRDGYLWFGTYNGLTRFDGERFTVFNKANSPGLSSSRITSLYEDREGTLWIGHDTGELSQLRDKRFKSVPIQKHWLGGSVVSILEDPQSHLWILGESGLLVRIEDGFSVPQDPETRPNQPLSIALDSQGRFWRAHGGRLRAITSTGITNSVPIPFKGYVVRLCAQQGEGLWVASNSELLEWIPGGATKRWGAVPWGDEPVTAMLETRAGLLWVGTQSKGLFVLDRQGHVARYHQANGLPHDWIRSLGEDSEGTLWIGTGSGVSALRPRRIVTVGSRDVFQGRVLLSVTSSRQGDTWVGTEGAGVFQFHNQEWKHYGKESGLENLFVWSIAQDPQGQLWAGTWGTGLYRYDAGRFVKAHPSLGEGLNVTALLPASDSGLWIGTQQGLIKFKDGRLERYAQDWQRPDVRAIAETPDRTVWFGMSGGGLGQLKGGELHAFTQNDGLPNEYVWSLLVDSDNADVLWIGTFGGGLCRLQSGHFKTIGEAQGLPNNVITHISDDGHGCLWLGSYSGILKVAKSELNRCADGLTRNVAVSAFGKGDGMESVACSGGLQPSGSRTPDGQIWFPAGRGIAVVDPAAITPRAAPFRPLIEQLLVDGQPTGAGNPPVPRVEKSGTAPAVEIPPGKHRLEFRFTAPSFAIPERLLFRYRLEGLETDWGEPVSKRTANYSFLPPGRYTFSVVASHGDGLWSPEPAVLRIVLLPYFWQTGWFRVGMALLLGAVVAIGARAYTQRQFRRRLEIMERQRAVERERARIAKDIHDDLGASLTRITLLSQTALCDLHQPEQAAADLDRIYVTARTLTRAMDEIVWAVNPSHDTLDSLVNYAGSFAQQFLSDANVRCRLDAPLDLPQRQVSAEVRHNVFLSFKEALHNVVKHARATEVRIALSLEDRGFKISIEDNGIGLPTPPPPDLQGDGIRNMRQRLIDIDGHCDIVALPNQGTRVTLTVKQLTPS